MREEDVLNRHAISWQRSQPININSQRRLGERSLSPLIEGANCVIDCITNLGIAVGIGVIASPFDQARIGVVPQQVTHLFFKLEKRQASH